MRQFMWRILQSPSRRFVAICVIILVIQAFIGWSAYHGKRAPHTSTCTSVHFICSAQYFMQHRVNSIWLEPHAALIAGILYGARTAVPKDLKNQFNTVGLTHVMAVSGYNVAVIANLCVVVLRGMGVRRKRAFLVVCVAVWFFVVFVGASASAVRAGIMGMVSLLGKTLGRGSSRAPVLLAAAVIMTAMHPEVLIADAGFHLSMLATIGLLYAQKPVEKYTTWIPERFGLREMIATTLAATILTLPYTSMVFGRISVISLLANVLVTPVIPLLMGAAMIAIVVGMISQILGIVVGAIAWVLSLYMVYVVRYLAVLPFASMNIQMSATVTVVCYSMLILWLLHEHKVLHFFSRPSVRLSDSL